MAVTRILDLDGHPSVEGEHQYFRLVLDGVDDLSSADVLRLTDRATGAVSYWRASPPTGHESLENTGRGWRGVLTQTDKGGK
ncbi:hypothetical protein [Caulobacter sp. S45]|uniref:hypothetical protein n=1 Tax=Caulobacter sp. S45 TaxID=1641861 RepID=UPI00131B35AC|nr:hypothetical protein [Caulobacter sp. S45]